MKKCVQTITVLLFLAIMGLSGCDQVKELATQEAEKVKKDVVSEIGKAVNGGGDQDKKEDSGSSKDSDKEKDEEK
ncbi:MAG: hypothetical protein OEV89_05010 [Desulfobulbaceae bacterium]|nr:hypothetical protein [Desulfobulbaceae bacterium]HIJ90108.1 hypothetical protein [Deltaproteobacteria bacterium]